MKGCWRPLYYLGNKTELAPYIKQEIDRIAPTGGAIDLFAGSGAISQALSHSRTVTAVDVQEYSRVICSATLTPAPMTPESVTAILAEAQDLYRASELRKCLSSLIEIESTLIVRARGGDFLGLGELMESHPLVVGDFPETDLGRLKEVTCANLKANGLWGPDSTASRYFGGLFFSFKQALDLDILLTVANRRIGPERDFVLAAALSAASISANTVGNQFAQPLRPTSKDGSLKTRVVRKACNDRAREIFGAFQNALSGFIKYAPASAGSRAVRSDFRTALPEVIESHHSVVYADPPYTRDHYSRFYHVLETLCLRDEPEVARVRRAGKSTASRGLYRVDRHQSPFSIRSQAPSAFDHLFSQVRQANLPLVLSYSPHADGDGTHPRCVELSTLLDIAAHHYSSVEVIAFDESKHSMLNRAGLALERRPHAELIIVAR